MRIALVLTPFEDLHLKRAAQIGVTDIVARYPASYGPDVTLEGLKQRVDGVGLKLSIVEGYIPHDRIVHGTDGRDEQIEGVIDLVREMGRLGIEVCCYNWMPDDDWTRTDGEKPSRGGARVTAFDLKQVDQTKPVGPDTSAEQLWDNLEYFLKRIVPVAEAEGVKLAMHPDDPPLAHMRGQDRIIHNAAAFDRALSLVDSDANGMCFCQGTFAEMGEDIESSIAHFGNRINYVHFRDVLGTPDCFEETFHDQGKTDMVGAVQAYHKIGYIGPARPDHVPALEGEVNDVPGYSMLGRLWAAGYMRGLIESIYR